MLLVLVFVVIFSLCRRRQREKRRAQKDLSVSPTWAGNKVPEEALKPHTLVTEIDSAPVAEMGGSMRFPVQIANSSSDKLGYYTEDHQDQVHELPADAITQRHPHRSRSSRAGRHHRHESTGQDSAVSGLSESERGSADVRPSLSHRRKTSEQSDKSNVSDVSTLQTDGPASPSASLAISPVAASPQNQMLPSSLRPSGPPTEPYVDAGSPEGLGMVSPIAERSGAEDLPLGGEAHGPASETQRDVTQGPGTAGSDAEGA